MRKIEKSIVFFEKLFRDDQLNTSHISLCVALFQIWEKSRFQNPYRIYRNQLMKLARIRSIATYHKCIKDLVFYRVIIYYPSYNSHKGTFIEIVDFAE